MSKEFRRFYVIFRNRIQIIYRTTELTAEIVVSTMERLFSLDNRIEKNTRSAFPVTLGGKIYYSMIPFYRPLKVFLLFCGNFILDKTIRFRFTLVYLLWSRPVPCNNGIDVIY